ncbi:MAG TPA: AraC family transcriptional regulator [Polyangiaceae bacterium]|nr:AraC family transcriptional regulator [Polyangiaceae bacterium]
MAVSVVLIRVLAEACTDAGVSAERLFNSCDFDPCRLNDNDGRVSMVEHERMVVAAIELTGNDALGLHIGERSTFSGFDVGTGLVAFAPNLREALSVYRRFQGIFGTSGARFGARLEEAQDHATLRYAFQRSGAQYNRFRAELTMAGFLRLIQYFAGGDANLNAVYFEHSAPDHAAEYARIFGGAARFEHAYTGIEFPRALLDRGGSLRDADLYAALEVLANRKLLKLEGAESVKTRVVEYLVSKANGRRPEMAEVAKSLGMSARSLRRRLNDEGISYAQACDEALAQVAKSVLSDPRQSIIGAAFALGFADAATFHRAFKRWTGITPKQYRQQLQS